MLKKKKKLTYFTTVVLVITNIQPSRERREAELIQERESHASATDVQQTDEIWGPGQRESARYTPCVNS